MIKSFIMRHFWLKVTALLLAVIAWLYVVGELDKGTLQEQELFEKILPYRLSAKEVPIKINILGNPPHGYRVVLESVTITPSTCVIFASKNFLRNVEYIATEATDISEYTKPVTRRIKLKPVRSGIILENDFFVDIVIPIEKIAEKPIADAQ